MRVFIDTNLWAYRLDRREPLKSSFIKRWLHQLAEQHEIVVSTQVLVELRSVLTRKFRPSFSWQDTRAALRAIAQFEVVAANANLVLDANELAEAHKLAWFDALIVEAALRSGCKVLYSEDLNCGQRIDGLEVHNPLANKKPRPAT